MSQPIKDSETSSLSGLGTFTHTTASTGQYRIQVRSTMQPASSLAISIAQTGSASNSISSIAPTPSDTQVGLQGVFQCVAGDLITITLSSSAIIDQGYNVIRSIIQSSRIE